MKTEYTVTVGNLGNVLTCHNRREAIRVFNEYKTQSKGGYGRASGENVTLFSDGEPLREFYSPAAQMREELESGECAVIHASGEVTLCGKHVARIGNDCTQAQGLRALREEMASQGFFPNCYAITDHGNVSCVSVRTGKAYKGM